MDYWRCFGCVAHDRYKEAIVAALLSGALARILWAEQVAIFFIDMQAQIQIKWQPALIGEKTRGQESGSGDQDLLKFVANTCIRPYIKISRSTQTIIRRQNTAAVLTTFFPGTPNICEVTPAPTEKSGHERLHFATI